MYVRKKAREEKLEKDKYISEYSQSYEKKCVIHYNRSTTPAKLKDVPIPYLNLNNEKGKL